MTTLSFAAQVDKWVSQTQERMGAVFRESAQRVIDDMVDNTPVDTGFLRASLRVTVGGQLPPLNRARPDGVGTFTAPAYAFTIAGAQPGDTIVAGYTANYAAFLEFGTDSTPPRGFVRGAAQRWPSIVRAVAREARSRAQTR